MSTTDLDPRKTAKTSARQVFLYRLAVCALILALGILSIAYNRLNSYYIFHRQVMIEQGYLLGPSNTDKTPQERTKG